jgi:hypothetical protein
MTIQIKSVTEGLPANNRTGYKIVTRYFFTTEDGTDIELPKRYVSLYGEGFGLGMVCLGIDSHENVYLLSTWRSGKTIDGFNFVNCYSQWIKTFLLRERPVINALPGVPLDDDAQCYANPVTRVLKESQIPFVGVPAARKAIDPYLGLSRLNWLRAQNRLLLNYYDCHDKLSAALNQAIQTQQQDPLMMALLQGLLYADLPSPAFAVGQTYW